MDVGFRFTGIALWSIPSKRFVSAGVLQTKDSNFHYVAENNLASIQFLANGLATIIGKARPLFILAEMPVGSSKSARATACMSMAFATVATACAVLRCRLEMVRPLEVKQAVGSENRSVSKEEVQKFVISKFGDSLLPKNATREHVCDAMACLPAYFLRHGAGIPNHTLCPKN